MWASCTTSADAWQPSRMKRSSSVLMLSTPRTCTSSGQSGLRCATERALVLPFSPPQQAPLSTSSRCRKKIELPRRAQAPPHRIHSAGGHYACIGHQPSPAAFRKKGDPAGLEAMS